MRHKISPVRSLLADSLLQTHIQARKLSMEDFLAERAEEGLHGNVVLYIGPGPRAAELLGGRLFCFCCFCVSV